MGSWTSHKSTKIIIIKYFFFFDIFLPFFFLPSFRFFCEIIAIANLGYSMPVIICRFYARPLKSIQNDRLKIDDGFVGFSRLPWSGNRNIIRWHVIFLEYSLSHSLTLSGADICFMCSHYNLSSCVFVSWISKMDFKCIVSLLLLFIRNRTLSWFSLFPLPRENMEWFSEYWIESVPIHWLCSFVNIYIRIDNAYHNRCIDWFNFESQCIDTKRCQFGSDPIKWPKHAPTVVLHQPKWKNKNLYIYQHKHLNSQISHTQAPGTLATQLITKALIVIVMSSSSNFDRVRFSECKLLKLTEHFNLIKKKKNVILFLFLFLASAERTSNEAIKWIFGSDVIIIVINILALHLCQPIKRSERDKIHEMKMKRHWKYKSVCETIRSNKQNEIQF